MEVAESDLSLVGPVGIEPTTCGLKGSVAMSLRDNPSLRVGMQTRTAEVPTEEGVISTPYPLKRNLSPKDKCS